jgi:hypothetical protein
MCRKIKNYIKLPRLTLNNAYILVKECVSQKETFVQKRYVINTKFCYAISSVRRETRGTRGPDSDNVALFQSPPAVICDPY